MIKYDFDQIIERKNTSCAKYDSPEVGDRLPLWVADMDFATPPFIIEALQQRLNHPVMGYPVVPSDYYKIISEWVFGLHGWKVQESSIRYIPGIVKGIGMVLNCFFGNSAENNKNVKVIIQPPVYHPFRILPTKGGYTVVENPLMPVEENGVVSGYRMDMEGLKRIIDDQTKVLILSNPHNPAGICWSKEELSELAEICYSKGIMVISDEIHAEMAHKGYKHIPFASVSEKAAACSITFMAPSKTFNIAGIVSSYAIVPDASLREKFFNYLDANEFDYPSIFSIQATMAAYKQGSQWRSEMLEYVEGNIDFVCEALKMRLPKVHCLKPQASFLLWMDFREFGWPQEKLKDLIFNKAGLYLNDGEMFGTQGKGFFRLNVGCPKSVLEDVVDRLVIAFEQELDKVSE